MADADEDAIPRTGLSGEDVDLSDEVQDFRFLNIISKDDAKIPKRGEKDFEPHQTTRQADILDASRQAMHDALSFQRVHPEKKGNLAIYHPETNMAYIDVPRSTLFKTLGTVFSPKDDPMNAIKYNSNRLWLLPEEILYLIERGTTDCRWPSESGDVEELGLPMSVQGAHAVFLGLDNEHDGGLTYARWSVYSYLKRAGYTVHRAPTWKTNPSDLAKSFLPPRPATWSRVGLSMFSPQYWYGRVGWIGTEPSEAGPLANRNKYRSYADIYRSLSVIPWSDPSAQPETEITTQQQHLRIAYHVWKPHNTEFKKSKPPPPDFRIAVTNARDTDLPTLLELSTLISTTPFEPPPEEKPLRVKLMHGYRSVILAVVDEGVTSFVKLADMASGLEPLYMRGPRPGRGGKRGGRGGRHRR